MSKLKLKIKFLKPFGKTNIFNFFFKFILFDIRISDLSGEIVICNIVFTWTKIFKAKEREMKGI
ncbi:MAG: hypothetical protein ACTSXT_08120 [Candidatus Helarchaeota archaeon]